MECRELWLVESQEMGPYLDRVADWPGVQLSGHLRRSRKRLGHSEWESRETLTWVSSLPINRFSARDINAMIRGYWAIENCLFRVRDVSYDEDRLHGRTIASCLATLRNTAISLHPSTRLSLHP